jgi:hypothetical protein
MIARLSNFILGRRAAGYSRCRTNRLLHHRTQIPLRRSFQQLREPVVLTAEVSKADILALKLGRNEHELITYKAPVVKSEPADPEGLEEYLRLRRMKEKTRLAACQKKVRKHLKDTTSAPRC